MLDQKTLRQMGDYDVLVRAKSLNDKIEALIKEAETLAHIIERKNREDLNAEHDAAIDCANYLADAREALNQRLP